MNNPTLSHAGRWMLHRRDFLRYGGTGLSAIALTALLSKQRLPADVRPLRGNERLQCHLPQRGCHGKGDRFSCVPRHTAP